MTQGAFWRQGRAAVKQAAKCLRCLSPPEHSMPVRGGRKRNLAESESGESLISWAMTLPVMFAFMFGLMKVCLLFYAYEYISETAREGTRWAIVRGTTCETSVGASCEATTTSVSNYVTSSTGLPNLAGGTVSAVTTYPDGNEAPGSRVKVVVTYTYPYKIPWVTTSTLTMSTTSEMYIIQ